MKFTAVHGRLAFVVATIAATSIAVMAGVSDVAHAVKPTLTIPGRVYPTIDTILNFDGAADPISGDPRTIEVGGLKIGPNGCAPTAANGFDIDDCPRVQMVLSGSTRAGLLRLPGSSYEDSNDPSDSDNLPDTWVNEGAVIEYSDTQGLDSATININGTENQINAVLAKLQLVPCTQQQGTFHDCGNNGVSTANEAVYEERESTDGLLPRLDILVIHGDNDSDTASGSIYFKVESANTAPYFDEVPMVPIDVASGAQGEAVGPTVSFLDDDMCKAHVDWCGVSYGGDDMAESDDQVLVLMWLAESNCGAFSFFGDSNFANKGSAGGLETVADVVKAWSGMSLNDPDQPSQVVGANAIAAAVQATLSPDAWLLDLSQQTSGNTTVFAGTATIGWARYAVDNISYNAPNDDADCHLNIAVSDLGNNGTPLSYVGSPHGPESPFTGQTYDHDNNDQTVEVPRDDRPYEVPDAKATSSSLTFRVRDGKPGVTISQILPSQLGDPAGPNKPSGFRISFDEAIDPASFDASDLSLATSSATGAALGVLVPVVPGSEYTVPVSAMGDGKITLEFTGQVYAAGHNGDAAYANEAPVYDDNEITWDATGPTVTVVKAASQPSTATVAPVHFTVTFSDTVTSAPIGFDTADLDLSGSSASLGLLTAVVTQPDMFDLKTYDVAVSGMTAGSVGDIVLKIKADAILDTALNGSQESMPATVPYDSTVADTTQPTVTITAQTAGPTSMSPVKFDVEFSEPVVDFDDASDVDLGSSTAPGTLVASISGSGANYVVSVSGMSGDGNVVASIPGNVAEDAAGNANTASGSATTAFDFDSGDTTAPTVVVERANGQASPTAALPVNFTVTFSEPVTGFDGSDVNIGGTAPGMKSVQVTGGPTVFNAAVIGATGAGTIVAWVLADAAVDAALNGNVASLAGPNGNSVQYEPPVVDNTPPGVTINQASGQADPATTSPVIFEIEFTEPVMGFTTNDVNLTGAAAVGSIPEVTGSGASYTLTVAVTQNGPLTATIGSGVATDLAGNPNTTATWTDNTVTVALADTTAPTVTVNQAAGQADPTTEASIVFDIVFSESVTGFVSNDVVVGGTAGATSATVSGSGSTYTATVATAGLASGTVVLSVPADVAQDAGSNGNTASTPIDDTVTFYVASNTTATAGGNVTIDVTGGGLTAFTSTNPSVMPPAGVQFPYGELSFSALTAPGELVTFELTLPAAVDSYYKLDSSAWNKFTWDGTTGAQIAGNVVTVVIEDNGRGDSDPDLGEITDPAAPAVEAITNPTDPTNPTTTVDPGDTSTTTSTTVPGGGDGSTSTSTTSTTQPGGGVTTTTLGGGQPVTTLPRPPGTPSGGGLPATGGAPTVIVVLGTVLLGMGLVLTSVRRRQAPHGS